MFKRCQKTEFPEVQASHHDCATIWYIWLRQACPVQVAGGLIDNVFKGNQAGTKTSASAYRMQSLNKITNNKGLQNKVNFENNSPNWNSKRVKPEWADKKALMLCCLLWLLCKARGAFWEQNLLSSSSSLEISTCAHKVAQLRSRLKKAQPMITDLTWGFKLKLQLMCDMFHCLFFLLIYSKPCDWQSLCACHTFSSDYCHALFVIFLHRISRCSLSRWPDTDLSAAKQPSSHIWVYLALYWSLSWALLNVLLGAFIDVAHPCVVNNGIY